MLTKFLVLSHGFDLLEGNIHDQNEPLGDELAMSRSHGSHSFKIP
jgi:hypothetical protein